MKIQEHLWTRKSSKAARHKLANTTEACNPVGRPLWYMPCVCSKFDILYGKQKLSELDYHGPKTGLRTPENPYFAGNDTEEMPLVNAGV